MIKTTPKRGGSRPGAGRKKGSSVYGETTKAISLPSVSPSHIEIPLFSGKVAAGFPSPPADDYIEKTLDLNDLLVQKPAATFFVRAEGCNGLIILEGFIAYNSQKLGLLND